MIDSSFELQSDCAQQPPWLARVEMPSRWRAYALAAVLLVSQFVLLILVSLSSHTSP